MKGRATNLMVQTKRSNRFEYVVHKTTMMLVAMEKSRWSNKKLN